MSDFDPDGLEPLGRAWHEEVAPPRRGLKRPQGREVPLDGVMIVHDPSLVRSRWAGRQTDTLQLAGRDQPGSPSAGLGVRVILR